MSENDLISILVQVLFSLTGCIRRRAISTLLLILTPRSRKTVNLVLSVSAHSGHDPRSVEV